MSHAATATAGGTLALHPITATSSNEGARVHFTDRSRYLLALLWSIEAYATWMSVGVMSTMS